MTTTTTKRAIVSQNRPRAYWDAIVDEIDAADKPAINEITDAMHVANTSRVSARMGTWSA